MGRPGLVVCLLGGNSDILDPGGKRQGQQAWQEPRGLRLTEGTPPPPLSFSIRSVMQKYLEDRGEVTFEKIFSQKLGEYEVCQPQGLPATVRLPRAWGEGAGGP